MKSEGEKDERNEREDGWLNEAKEKDEKMFQKLFSTLYKPNKGISESYFVHNMFSANHTLKNKRHLKIKRTLTSTLLCFEHTILE